MASKLRQMGMTRAGDIYKVDPRVLEDCPYGNIRRTYDPIKLQELADSIKIRGVTEPVTVYTENGTIYLTSGHRRKRAALLAIDQGVDIQYIPAKLQPKEERGELDILVSQLVANQSEEIAPLDEAHHFYRFIKHGWSQQRIATTFGYRQSYVSNRIALLRAEEPLQAAVENHTATATEVVAAVRTAERESIPQPVALAKHRATKALGTPKPIATMHQDEQETHLTHLVTVLPLDVVLGIVFSIIPKSVIAHALETGEVG